MSTHFARGFFLWSSGRSDLAEREYRRVLAETPDNAMAHSNLASCLMDFDNRREEALREADEAVRLAPDQPWFHNTRGEVLWRLKRFDEAEAAVIEAIRLDPTNSFSFSLLACILNQPFRAREAIEAAEKGLALEPSNHDLTIIRAIALIHLDRQDEAEASLGAVLSVDPENAFAHATMGWSRLKRRDYKRSSTHYREALRRNPSDESARLGLIQARRGRNPIYRCFIDLLYYWFIP